MTFKRTKSRCDKCPLSGNTRVWSEYNIDKPKIAFLAEAPGSQEELQKKPLVGPSGSLIQQAAAKGGIIWHTTYRMNAICCRPPNNAIDSIEGQAALECCKPGLVEELAFANKLGIKVIGALGGTAMHALGIEGSITKQRGSVSVLPTKQVAVPTFHPSYIMRGNWNEEVTWINDLLKIRDLSLKKYKPPVERFNLFPTAAQVVAFVREAVDKLRLTAVDIETTGLNPFYAKILMIGLALNGEDAVVVPFTKRGGSSYWSTKDHLIVKVALKELFAKAPTMFQNAAFDTWHLERQGYPVRNLQHDTMLMHHAIHPELKHNLGYIVSLYGDTPYWKDVALGNEERMINMDDKEIRTYNARDTVVLHQILPGLLEDLKDAGTENTYKMWSMRLVAPLRRMSDRGILVDRVKLKGKAIKFKKEVTRTSNLMKKIAGLPDDFNFDSTDQVRYLLYGIQPKTLETVYKGLAEYEANPKLKRTTKKYAELVAKKKLLEGIKPLYKTKATIRKTDSGAASTDDEALIGIQRAAIGRLDALEGVVRFGAKQLAEQRRLQQLLDFIAAFRKYAAANILATTFTGFPVMPDGRVHFSYKIHGTRTGRLSSGE